MSYCGTTFKDNSLTANDKETLRELELVANRLEWQAEQLRYAINYCIRNETLKGLSDMVAYSFNAQQHQPQYGGGSGGLPAGPNGENVKYKVVIVNSAQQNVEKGGMVTGGYLAFDLVCIEGPQQNVKHTDRLNLHHVKPDVVEIANKQLSAYCHVLGKFQFADTAELHNIPFIVEVGLQKSDEARAKGYTEIKAIYDINGNEPGKAGGGAPVHQPQQPAIPQAPAAGVQPTGAWGAGQPGQPAIDNNVPMQQQQPPAQQPPAQQQPNGWGAPPAQQPAQQPPAQQPAAGWGAPAGGAPAQPPGWGAPAA